MVVMRNVAQDVLLNPPNNSADVQTLFRQWLTQAALEARSILLSHDGLVGKVFDVSHNHRYDFMTKCEHFVPRELKRVVSAFLNHDGKRFYCRDFYTTSPLSNTVSC